MLAKSLWLALALAALGLWASLVPQVTFTSASTGDPEGDVLIAWPGWGVQQDLGPVSGTLGRFRIWVSGERDGGEMTVQASLVDASTRMVLRQTFIEAKPFYIPVARTFTFPSYVVPEGQRLLLQLQVLLPEKYHVIYRLAVPQPGLANVMLNGVPDSRSGPLAVAHLETGSGLRAAVAGEPTERIRLVLGVVLSVLAVVAHPRVAMGMRRIGGRARHHAGWPAAWARGLGRSREIPEAGQITPIGRFLAVPWYPWPIAAAPILHFLANNRLSFAAVEAVVPLIIVLVVVTGSVVGLRFILKDWYRPAAATAVCAAVLFAYGHVESAFGQPVEDRVLFPITIVVLAATVGAVFRANRALARHAQFLNLAAAVLLVFPVVSLAGGASESLGRTASTDATSSDDVLAHFLPSGLPPASDDRPDIYYIILDEYARHDALVDFDNTGFLRELERRGFYVASEATSNYMRSQHSISSLLNMSYLDSVGPRTPSRFAHVLSIGEHHAVGMILNELGYTYVHLTSGHSVTDKAPLADVVVNFAPSGVMIGDAQSGYESSISLDSLLVGRFVRELIQTTALRPILGHQLAPGGDALYPWWHPDRVLQMFDFLTNPIAIDSPKFVFAHIVKPHLPATFDQYGNRVPGLNVHDNFHDDHDPSVPSAYIGQLIYVNSRILEMIDGILRHQDDDSIIVISADHGRDKEGWGSPHAILAAFYLPDGGDRVLYSSISSVNHFRAIFDFYFDLDLGLLEDRRFQHSGHNIDFHELPAETGT